jgi:serine/threonine protein kinase
MYGNFDEESAMKILYQLSNVLIYLHTQVGISHYDLKPANILINKHHCLKLTDFDLARSTKAPAVSCEEGTLKYLPPECFVRKYPEHSCTAEKADIWMVGVIFCSMLWGKHPIYPEKTSLDNMKRIVEGYNGDVDFLNHPQVSMLSQHIIRGCLQPDPSSRPSALQLFQVLSSQFRSTA